MNGPNFLKYNIIPYGRFVAFDSESNGKIRLAHSGDYVIGVTTINSTITSDDPEEWQGKYMCNEFGDLFLQEHSKAIAEKQFDSKLELPYISTIKKTEMIPVINEEFDSNKEYVKRSDRQEWIRVNLLGKCIVVDNGECQPGKFCRVSNDGIAIPSDYSILSKGMPYVNNWYVIDRITEHTILIFFK